MKMDRNFFVETCRFDISSSSNNNNSIDQHCSYIYPQSQETGDLGRMHRLKLATKKHVLEINSNLDNVGNGLNIRTSRSSLPFPTNGNGPNSKIFDKDWNKVRFSDRECISHSYLYLPSDKTNIDNGNDGVCMNYIEAFILKVTPALLDDTQHSMGNTSSVFDKRKDDQTLIYHETASRVEHEYHLVVRGYLPSSSSNSKNPSSIREHLVDTKTIVENEAKNNIETKFLAKKKIKCNTKKTRNKAKRQETMTHALYNHTSSILVSKESSNVKLCRIEDLDDHSKENFSSTAKIIPVCLFVAEGSSLNLYQISAIPLSEGSISTSSYVASFNIIKKALTVNPFMTKSISTGDEFVSMLLDEESPSPSNNKTDGNGSNILELNSQVKALDTLHIVDDNNHIKSYLAIGCENGLVRIMSFAPFRNNQREESIYLVNSRNEFSVDGTVNVVYFTKCHGYIDLVVGTSCGYVCLFRDPLNTDQPFHQEPFILMEGIWNPKKKDDDTVISACKYPSQGNNDDDMYAIGTQSGHVYVVANQKREGAGYECYDYKCLWYVYLYHPINAIAFAVKENRPIFIVITKEAVHWFSLNAVGN